MPRVVFVTPTFITGVLSPMVVVMRSIVVVAVVFEVAPRALVVRCKVEAAVLHAIGYWEQFLHLFNISGQARLTAAIIPAGIPRRGSLVMVSPRLLIPFSAIAPPVEGAAAVPRRRLRPPGGGRPQEAIGVPAFRGWGAAVV